MIQYILFVLICCILIFFAYIKLKYPFWNNIPVFHTYDYFRYFYSKPYIMYKYPIKTKFLDLHQINTYNILDITDEQNNEFLNLLQCYYIPTENITHNISLSELNSYFIGCYEPCYISFHYPKKIITDNSQILINYTTNFNACITSRPFNFYIRSQLTDSIYDKHYIYFIDYICSQRNEIKQNINRKLLQTHLYNQSVLNPSINISIIKKDFELLEGVVPFVSYFTYTYHLSKIKMVELPDHYYIESINENNFHLLIDFFNNINNQTNTAYFDTFIFSDVSNIMSLIKNKLLYIYCLKKKKSIYGFYFFKNTKTLYDNIEGSSVQLIASIINCSSLIIFYKGFINSLYTLKKINKEHKILLIDDINHNQFILNFWNQNNQSIFSNKSAYYLINYIYPPSPLLKERSFILI